MFKKKNSPVEKETQKVKQPKERGPILTISGIVAAILVIIAAGAGTGGYLIHLSNTSPEFCASCHIMQKNVNSYLTSSDMDHVHAQAHVQCKDCHDYSLGAEITSGVKYVIGDYTVDTKGELTPVTYSDEMCLKCHISDDYLANATDFLHRNPHKNHNGQLACKTCHISHGKQVNYCGSCHDNGGQRLTGEEVKSRDPLLKAAR